MPDCALTDHRRGLHGVERADRLAEKIGKSRGVDQVDTRVLRIDMHDRCAQRMLPRSFERVEVAHRRAALDGTRFLDRTGREQQRLGQRGLARSALTDERNRTNVAGGVVRHAPVSFDVCSRKLYGA
jgi:asparagine synthetase B (glutamine-hydrolysing)